MLTQLYTSAQSSGIHKKDDFQLSIAKYWHCIKSASQSIKTDFQISSYNNCIIKVDLYSADLPFSLRLSG